MTAYVQPVDMEQSWFDTLVKHMIPMELITYMSDEFINNSEALAFYCDGTEQIFNLLIQKVPATRDQRKWLVPLSKIHAMASAKNKHSADAMAKGVLDEEMEIPLDQMVVDDLNTKHKASYGYELSPFEMLWGHLLGRLKREVDNKKYTTIALNRVGSEVEGGRCPATRKWAQAPGVTVTVNATAGATRNVENNFRIIDLLEKLLDGYNLVGNFQDANTSERWCDKEATHDYFVFTEIRICLSVGDWPPMQRCLETEYQVRCLWVPFLRKGKTLTQAINYLNES